MTTVADLMTRDAQTCHPQDSLHAAAATLWRLDCGALPVVDDGGRPVGMLTDRDICMAALSRGQRLHEMLVAPTLSGAVHVVREDDDVAAAHETMRRHQVRRLPVVDGEGVLAGVLSLADVARAALADGKPAARKKACEELGATLGAIVRPHGSAWNEPATRAVKKAPAKTTRAKPAGVAKGGSNAGAASPDGSKADAASPGSTRTAAVASSAAAGAPSSPAVPSPSSAKPLSAAFPSQPSSPSAPSPPASQPAKGASPAVRPSPASAPRDARRTRGTDASSRG